MKMMLEKKQIQVIFLLMFKMGCKAAKILPTSMIHLAQKLLMNTQCGGGSRRFAKKAALKLRSIVACHRKLTMTN